MHVLRVTGFFLGALVLLALVGLIGDLFGGLQFSRRAPTWSIWVGGLILGGLLYALSDGLFDWAAEPDRTADPVAKRVLRLTAALAAVAVLIIALWVIAIRRGTGG